MEFVLAMWWKPRSRIRQYDEHCWIWLSGVVHTAVLRTLTQRCAAHCGARLSSVLHIAEHDSEECCTLRSLTQRFAAHCGAWLSGVLRIAEPDSAVCCTLQSLTQRWAAHCGAQLSSAEPDSTVCCTLWILTQQCAAHCGAWLCAWHSKVLPRTLHQKYFLECKYGNHNFFSIFKKLTSLLHF